VDAGWAYSRSDRVRFADLDPRGHLNNVAFLQFFEAARIAYLAHVDPDNDASEPATDGLILAEQTITYRSPSGLEDEIRTCVRPEKIKRSSFRLAFFMHNVEHDRPTAEGHGVYVGYDYGAGAARPLPDGLARALRAALRDPA